MDLKPKMVVGITGGIGSGKTFVADLFAKSQIPVYNADTAAKRLMQYSNELKQEIIGVFGEMAYVSGELNKAFLSKQIFSQPSLLQKINALVHPAVARDFKNWLILQKGPYVIKESAIIFENNLQHQMDKVILVVADYETKVQRVKNRDGKSEVEIHKIMKNQLPDSSKKSLSNYVIYNNNNQSLSFQIHNIHQRLSSTSRG